MLIFGDKKFIQTSFESEEELEMVVFENYENIFGPSSIYLPKKMIKTKEGIGTIPDGFVVDLSSRQWYVVEAEIGRHSVWTHIAPQVSKQIIASRQPKTKKQIVEIIVDMLRDDSALNEKFMEEEIDQIDIRRVLDEIVQLEPVIGMPIDSISADLREWAATLKSDVKLWLIRKYIEFGNDENVMYEIPEEFRPALDTREEDRGERSITQYDVTIANLIEAGHLAFGETLYMSYKPKEGDRVEYQAEIQEDGSLLFLDKRFSTPSYAALFGIQQAGSSRRSVNGWRSWKTSSGSSLIDVREKFLIESE